MTGTYQWNPMPHVLDIQCPDCRGPATFEFAEVVRIRRKQDVPFFQNHRLLEYALFEGSSGAGRWHGAIFYAGLHAQGVSALAKLPEGYSPTDWNHSRYWYRTHGLDAGARVCAAYGARRKHTLRWPGDARFQFAHRGERLWAFNRESAIVLRDYIESGERKRTRWASFLLHVPTAFLTAKARPEVVKRLNRMLRV